MLTLAASYPGLSCRSLPIRSLLLCTQLSFQCGIFPLMVSGEKPAAGTDFVCYQLVAWSLKEDFAALSTDIVLHQQGISRQSPISRLL
jgi:hypothetical protein